MAADSSNENVLLRYFIPFTYNLVKYRSYIFLHSILLLAFGSQHNGTVNVDRYIQEGQKKKCVASFYEFKHRRRSELHSECVLFFSSSLSLSSSSIQVTILFLYMFLALCLKPAIKLMWATMWMNVQYRLCCKFPVCHILYIIFSLFHYCVCQSLLWLIVNHTGAPFALYLPNIWTAESSTWLTCAVFPFSHLYSQWPGKIELIFGRDADAGAGKGSIRGFRH